MRYLRHVHLLLVSLLVWLAPPALAQFGFDQDSMAAATLYSRVEGDTVEVAIEIEIDPDWHLYHHELGQPDSVGTPTTIELLGEGIEWGEIAWPEPERQEQPGIGKGGRDTWILYHHDIIVLRASGELAAGATGDDVGAEISGQTCETNGQCLPYEETVYSEGRGDDELFAGAAGVADDDGDDGSIEGWDLPEQGEAPITLYARVVNGDEVQAVVEIDITEDWHLFHTDIGAPDAAAVPSVLQLGGKGITWGQQEWPEPHVHDQPGVGKGGADTWAYSHEGIVEVRVAGRLGEGADLEEAIALLEGQTCENRPLGMCVQVRAGSEYEGEGFEELYADWTLEAPQAGEVVEATPAAMSSGDGGGAEAPAATGENLEEADLWTFLLLAVGWGLFALLMPCTYPMIPITISFFTKQASDRGGKVLPLSLAYGAGIVLMFVLIGVIVGPPIVRFATHPATNIVIGSLFLFFALTLFGVINLQPPRFMLNLAGQASMKGGFLGVFLMGLTFVVTSFTCTAPFVGSLLSVGASSGDIGRVALGMGVFGLTMAIPFVFLSLVPGRIQAMPRAGEWMHVLKVFLGFVEVAAAIKFFSNADLVLGWEIISRELFLILWAAIFGVAAVFLFGLIRMEGEKGEPITAKRMVAALAVLLMSGYCYYGIEHKLDWVMDAIVPNYSNRLYEGAAPAVPEHTIIKDDYDLALETARTEGKALLVNFTGHT